MPSSNIIQIGSSEVRPSWSQGFARGLGDAENPSLWDGLVGHWPLDFGATGLTAHDVSGRGGNGTLLNGLLWVPEGLKGDGVDQTAPLDSALLAGATACSIATWVFPTTNAAKPIFGATGGSGDKAFILGTSPSDANFRFYWRVYGDTSPEQFSASVLAINTWYFIFVNWDGSTKRIYINGKFDSSQALTGAISANPRLPILFGGGVGAGRALPFDGIMGSLAVWDRALAASEIVKLASDRFAITRRRTKTVVFFQAPVTGIQVGILHRGQLPGILARAG